MGKLDLVQYVGEVSLGSMEHNLLFHNSSIWGLHAVSNLTQSLFLVNL